MYRLCVCVKQRKREQTALLVELIIVNYGNFELAVKFGPSRSGKTCVDMADFVQGGLGLSLVGPKDIGPPL